MENGFCTHMILVRINAKYITSGEILSLLNMIKDCVLKHFWDNGLTGASSTADIAGYIIFTSTMQIY